MNVKRFLSDSFRRDIDNRVNSIVNNYKISTGKFNKSKKKTTSGMLKFSCKNGELGENEARLIYKCKCYDLELLPNETSQTRFVEQFINGIKEKSLRFTGLGLGPLCMDKLALMLMNTRKYLVLDFSLNRLQDQGALALAHYLASNPQVISLDLRSNAIQTEGSSNIFYSLCKNYHVTYLDISTIDGIDRNRLGTPGSKALAHMLKMNQVVSHLNLSMCGITLEGCKCIGEALPLNTGLMYLDLTANRLGQQGVNALFSKEGSFCNLDTLILSKNGVNDAFAQILLKQLKKCKRLRTLDISDNELTEKFLEKMYNVLMGGFMIKNLNLSRNKIKGVNLDYLELIIRDFDKLKSLNISYNKLKDDGVSRIANALVENKSLINLDLTSTYMGDGGALAFAECFKYNNTLQKLHLDHNKITDTGGAEIFRQLENNTSLVHISISSNELKDDTAEVLMETLKKNTTLSEINIAMNDFSYRSYIKTEHAIEEHKKELNSKIVDVAEKHVEWLKSEEQKLFQYRADIKTQEMAVKQTSLTKQLKLEQLGDIKKSNAENIKKREDELNSAKDEHEKASEFRLENFSEISKLKIELEIKEGDARLELQSCSVNRQKAEGKFRAAERRRKENNTNHQKKMKELQTELELVKDRLKKAIKENIDMRQKMEDEEKAEQMRLKEEEALAKKAAKAAKKKGKKKKSKVGKETKASSIRTVRRPLAGLK